MVFVQIRDNLYVNPEHVVSIDYYPDANGDINISIYVMNRADPYVVRGVDDVEQWLTRFGMTPDVERALPYLDVRDKEGRVTVQVDNVDYIYLKESKRA